MTQYPDIMAILRVCLTVTYLLGMGESTYGDRDFWRFGWCDVVMLVTSKVWGGKKRHVLNVEWLDKLTPPGTLSKTTTTNFS